MNLTTRIFLSVALPFLATMPVLCPAARSADGVTLTVTRADCSRLVAHVPDPGVAYQPGVDVRGRPVAPADLGGGPALELPDEVYVPVTLDMLARYGLPANSKLYKLDDTLIGTARIRVKDGRAWFNGVPLGTAEDHALARACQELRKRRRKTR
ncbi:MAG TPA: hypothetical protein VLN73_09205 [Alphaproteobacteria bacterium]|nr:hypothetical protein [Alphaproteobacteria bacterium]